MILNERDLRKLPVMYSKELYLKIYMDMYFHDIADYQDRQDRGGWSRDQGSGGAGPAAMSRYMSGQNDPWQQRSYGQGGGRGGGWNNNRNSYGGGGYGGGKY